MKNDYRATLYFEPLYFVSIRAKKLKENQDDSTMINQLQARLEEKENWIKELQGHNEI
ncbi:MAG: hypothetical protein PHO71_26085 [Bacteroides sp.]|nr:hypothetical protein [Bacteroides sp.]MDD3041320.1 hypothetical protein [Bacteroides sp.]